MLLYAPHVSHTMTLDHVPPIGSEFVADEQDAVIALRAANDCRVICGK